MSDFKKSLFITTNSLQRLEHAQKLTGGLVGITYHGGILRAVLTAPKERDEKLHVVASVANKGMEPFTLSKGGTESFTLTTRSDKNKLVGILLDKDNNPVKILTIKRFGDGFSIHVEALEVTCSV